MKERAIINLYKAHTSLRNILLERSFPMDSDVADESLDDQQTYVSELDRVESVLLGDLHDVRYCDAHHAENLSLSEPDAVNLANYFLQQGFRSARLATRLSHAAHGRVVFHRRLVIENVGSDAYGQILETLSDAGAVVLGNNGFEYETIPLVFTECDQ
ncbi:MAG: hypothetical protein H6502_01665 [Candidatus Woesearchaeota archaeon]|nr:MAG: hypothetical protein H6502_01665 [Candidatus Woesearchaeota archaeon]